METRTRNGFTTALGGALLLQACSSLVSGAVLFDPLVVSSDIGATMLNVANHPVQAYGAILIDLITAMGIVWLAVLLFSLLRKTNPVWATTALALYLFEAGILMVSKCFGYAFIRVSEMYLANVDNAQLVLGQVLLQVTNFAYHMHIIPFGVGALLFYGLLKKSGAVPSWLASWGFFTVIPVLIGIPLLEFGVPVPMALLVPYMPFEFFAGAYILAKGISDPSKPDSIRGFTANA